MNEIWKSIPGYNGQYEASTLGSIRTVDYSKNSKKDRYGNQSSYIRKGKTLSQCNADRYLIVRIKKASVSVHRLVALTFLPRNSDNLQVNHIDGDRYNNKVENLEWVTAKENVLHAHKNGLAKYTPLTESGMQKLRESKYKKIININTGKVYKSMSEAAKENNISLSQLSQKVNGIYPNNTSLCFAEYDKSVKAIIVE